MEVRFIFFQFTDVLIFLTTDDETEPTITSSVLLGEQSLQHSTNVPLIELLGEQLLQHSIDGSTGTNKYIVTSQLHGKIIGLYFS